jgi:DNA-binding response OmpR family regulator
MRILVVEDEKKVASFLKKGLEEEYYAVDCAYDGEEALYMVEANEYDLMILDIMLPKIDGLEVLKGVRDKALPLPVLMLTAKDSIEDVVKGLDAGGDDYLTKPFAFAELLARVRALFRRKEREPAGALQVADLAYGQGICPPRIPDTPGQSGGDQDHDIRTCVGLPFRSHDECHRCLCQSPA